jgi:endoglucanase
MTSRFNLFAALALGLTLHAGVGAEPLSFTGVNLAGGEFYQPKPGVRPKYGQSFSYPVPMEIEYFSGQGMNILRYCFLWETLQAEARQELDKAEVERLKTSVKLATAKKLVVVLDPHNYARYYGQIVGGPKVSSEDFADFWRRLSLEFADDPYVWFGLVNEPHGMPTQQWFDAAQAAINAIRAAGAKNLILVPGNAWSGAQSWTAEWYGGSNAKAVLGLKDPLDHWAIEVHQYLDKDASGTKPEVVSETVGSERLKNFVSWCRQNHRRAFLGEFAVATNAPAEAALKDMLQSMERDRDVWLGWTWWAAGSRWGNYLFLLEPRNGKDRPQIAWVRPFLHGTVPPKFTLSVKNGQGQGGGPACSMQTIMAAPAPAGQVFDKWTGDVAWLQDPASAKTTLMMPFKNMELQAVYRKAP